MATGFDARKPHLGEPVVDHGAARLGHQPLTRRRLHETETDLGASPIGLPPDEPDEPDHSIEGLRDDPPLVREADTLLEPRNEAGPIVAFAGGLEDKARRLQPSRRPRHRSGRGGVEARPYKRPNSATRSLTTLARSWISAPKRPASSTGFSFRMRAP